MCDSIDPYSGAQCQIKRVSHSEIAHTWRRGQELRQWSDESIAIRNGTLTVEEVIERARLNGTLIEST